MTSPEYPMKRPRSLTAPAVGLAVVVGNLLPLVGIAVWGWNLTALLALYWFETVVTTVLTGGKLLFAERASTQASARLQPLSELTAKRGGFRVRADWPPVYVRNVPFAVGVLGVSGVVLVVYGLVLALWLSVDPTAVVSAGFVASALGLVVARLAEFRADYLGREEYRDVSARMLAATPARQLLLLLCLVPVASSGAGGRALLVAVVAAKLLSDGYGFLVEHTAHSPGRLGEWLLGPRDTAEPPPTVDAPDVEPDVRVDTDTRAVLLGGTAPVAAGLASRPGYLAGFVFVLGWFVFGTPVVVAAGLALCLVAGVKLGAHYLRVGTLQYQRRGDHLVAYDRLLDEPQWATPVRRLRDVDVENRVADRLLGTGTLTLSAVESGGRSAVQLGPVADLDRAVDRLGLPAVDTSRPETDRRIVAVAAALGGCFLAVPLGLYALPSVSQGQALGVTLLLGPFFLLLVGILVASGLSRI